jgi:hypothetical protein
MKVFMPSELRNMTINIIRYVMTTHVNTNIGAADAFQLGIMIDSQIIPLNKWA